MMSEDVSATAVENEPVQDAPIQDAEARAAVADLATYKWGFSTDIESEMAPKGLTTDTVRYISAKKGEPEWLLDWRLKAFAKWLTQWKARLGQARYRADRLSGRLLLRRAQGQADAGLAR
jgi:hypothetical protein